MHLCKGTTAIVITASGVDGGDRGAITVKTTSLCFTIKYSQLRVRASAVSFNSSVMLASRPEQHFNSLL